MEQYKVEFYSNNGYLLGESIKEYKDFSEVEQFVEDLIKNHTTIKIALKTKVDLIKISEIAKVTITKQE